MSPPLLSATVLNGVERGWKSIVVEARRARRWRRRKEEAKRYARHRNPWFVACSVARESAWKNLWGSAVAKDWFVRTSWVSRPSFLPLEKLRGRTRWKIYLVSGIRAKKKVLLPGKIAGTPRDLVNRWGGSEKPSKPPPSTWWKVARMPSIRGKAISSGVLWRISS